MSNIQRKYHQHNYELKENGKNDLLQFLIQKCQK